MIAFDLCKCLILKGIKILKNFISEGFEASYAGCVARFCIESLKRGIRFSMHGAQDVAPGAKA